MTTDHTLPIVIRAIDRIRRGWPVPLSEREADILDEAITLAVDEATALASPPAGPALLSVQEAARRLRVNKVTVQRALNDGQLTAERAPAAGPAGFAWRIPAAEVERFGRVLKAGGTRRDLPPPTAKVARKSGRKPLDTHASL